MDSSSNLEIHTPIQYVPGVGAERAPLFERLKLRKAIDLLFYFPRSYQEVTACKSVSELKDGLRVTLSGIVVDTESRFGFSGNSTVGVLVAVDGGGYVRCVWYNQPFRRDSHPVGQRLLARGVVQSSGVAYQMRHPEITVLAAGEPVPDAKPRPVYPLTEGLNQLHISRAVRAVLPLADQMEEALPMEVRQAAAERLRLKSPHLLGIADALRQIHEPDTMEQTTDARTRFIFQELFVLQLALAVHRHAYQHERPAPSIQATPMIHNRILKRFPFQLTQDQLRVIEEIRGDMAKTVPKIGRAHV